MNEINRMYLRLLKIELEDLREDLDALIRGWDERLQHHEVTRYVVLENVAVLRNEILGVSGLSHLLGQTDPDAYDDLDSMVADLRNRCAQRLKEHNLPEGPHRMICRKLDKVAQYVRMHS